MDLGVTGFRIDSYLPSIIWKESASSMVPCFFAFLGIGLGHTTVIKHSNAVVNRTQRWFSCEKYGKNIYKCPTWWLIPLSKWVLTPVINGTSRVNPFVTGVITHLLYKWDELPSSFDRTSRNDPISGPAATWIHLGHGVRSLARISLPHDPWGTGILELLSRWSYQILCKSSIFAADIPRLVQQIPVLVETMHEPLLDRVFVDKYRSVPMKSKKTSKNTFQKVEKLSEKP